MFTPTYFSERMTWLFEALFWGAGFFFLTNWIMQYENQLKSFVTQYFVKIWAAVGLFSYSLYLVHDFILGAFAGYNKLLLVFMTLAFAYIFFLVFEKPFMIYLSKRRS
jgi:peptidoglycan/LPS O-acetylase OafA/YrhL